MAAGQPQTWIDDDSLQGITRKESRLERVRRHFPYWILPLISATFWFVMLWAMMIFWLVQGRPIYSSMNDSQRIAFISDIGADVLKPLFITGCSITSLFFFLSLCTMHRNHALVHSIEKGLDWASIISGAAGAAGLVLLAVFDTARHPALHSTFLLVFMLGIVCSALFTTLEYRRLGKAFIERTFLKLSYRFKQVVIVLEVTLSVAFGITTLSAINDPAAVLEWLISFIFTLYVFSFFFDLGPKARTREELQARREMFERQRVADGQQV